MANWKRSEVMLAYVEYCNEKGSSFDPYDMNYTWINFQRDPSKYKWLIPFLEDVQKKDS